MQFTFPEQVFYTLNGLFIPEYNIPGVENAFAAGEKCLELYSEARKAYYHICERLGGCIDEDPDGEIIFNNFLDLIKIISLKMYHYGAVFGERPPYDYQSPL